MSIRGIPEVTAFAAGTAVAYGRGRTGRQRPVFSMAGVKGRCGRPRPARRILSHPRLRGNPHLQPESPVRDAPPLGDGGNPRRGRSRGTAPTFNSIGLLRPVYTGTLLAVWAGSPRRRGRRPWRRGRADLIVYGRPFIANPDLVEPILPGTLSGLAGTSPSRARQPAQLRTLSTSCLSIGR